MTKPTENVNPEEEQTQEHEVMSADSRRAPWEANTEQCAGNKSASQGTLQRDILSITSQQLDAPGRGDAPLRAESSVSSRGPLAARAVGLRVAGLQGPVIALLPITGHRKLVAGSSLYRNS